MKLQRTLHPETRVLDPKAGLVEYTASDETLDAYREIIRADGWRFDDFQKNAPFVDSHNYDSIENLLGKVIDFGMRGRKLINVVQWAIDVPENALAKKGFAMTEAGYLKAVSVGFVPVRAVTPWDPDKTQWKQALHDLKLEEKADVRCIYLEQQQKELSACVLGANPNAVARAFKAGILDEADLELFSSPRASSTVSAADGPAAAAETRQRERRTRFLDELQKKIKQL